MDKKILAAVALLTCAAGPAWAGDMNYGSMKDDAAMPFSWSGVYIGVNGGMGSGDSDVTEGLPLIGATLPLPFTIPTEHSSTYGAAGGIGGVQLGVNKQMGNFVVGGELGLDGADINGSSDSDCFGVSSLLAPLTAVNVTCSSEVTWVATALAKLGYAHGPWMFYGTAGWAVAGVDHELSVDVPVVPLTVAFAQQDTADGFAVGGGGEVALTDTVSLGLEYLHADLESKGEGLLLGGAITTGDRDIDLDIFRARLNFRLGG